MSDGNLSLTPEVLLDESVALLKLKDELTFNTVLLTKAKDGIHWYHSDFLDKMNKTIKEMIDTKTVSLIKELETYCNALQIGADGMKEADDSAKADAAMLSGGKK